MRPTLRGARLCSTQDVILICWAVARNVIPLITRRLDNDERKQLRSGDIFVWEERVDPEGLGPGIERWTDGMKWGPSRVKNEFLFYHQKTSERREERRLSVDDHHASSTPSPPEVYGYEADPEHCLVKQSYSVKLKLPETKNEEKKWHITAYFTPATVEFLRPVSTFPEIGNADVPSGWIEAARGHKQLKLEPPSATSSTIPISREPYASSSSSSSSSSLSAPEGSHHSDARLYRPSTVGHHYTDGSHTAATYSPPSRPSHSILLSASPPTSTGIASSSSSSSSSTIAAPTRHPRLPEYVHMQQHNGSGSSSSSSHQHHDDDPMTGSRLQSPPPASRPMHEHRRAHHSSASSSSPYARVRQSPPELSFRRMHLDGADDEVTKTVSHHHHHQKQQQQQSSHHHHHHQSYQQQQQHKSPSSFHDNLSLPPSSFNVSTSPTSTAAAAMMMIGAAASRKSDRDLVPLSKLRGNQVPPRDPADQLQLRMLPLSRILG